MSDMRIETNLRPLPEGRSAFISFLFAAYLFFFSAEVFMAPAVAFPASIFLICYGLWRLWQYAKLKYYQQHLTAAPRYIIPFSKIKSLKNLDFYGKGFEWRSKHVARLEEAEDVGNEKYLKKPLSVRVSTALSLRLQKMGLNSLEAFFSADRWYNPLRPLPEIGGKPQMHGVGLLEDEKDIFETIAEAFGHREIIGTTRCGKTTAARILIRQSILRGGPVFILDPKGDPDLLKAIYLACKDAGKLEKFGFLHLGHESISMRYSPMHNINRETEISSITTSSLPDIGHSAQFKDFSWRYVNTIGKAMLVIKEPVNFKAILNYAKSIDQLFVKYCEQWMIQVGPKYPSLKKLHEQFSASVDNTKDKKERIEEQWPLRTVVWMRLLSTVDVKHPDAIDDTLRSLLSVINHPREHFQKLVTNIYPLLEKLTTGNVGKILSPDYTDLDSPHDRLDIRTAIKEDQVIYMGLDALSDVTVASTFCSIFCADLVTTLGEIYNHGITPGVPDEFKETIKRVDLYGDEANELMIKEFMPMVNKGGGAGLCVTTFTQSSADKEVKLGSKARAQAVSSNFNTQIYFRVRNRETAMEFTSQLGKARFNQAMIFTGAVDSPDPKSSVEYTSSTQQRLSQKEVPLLSPEDLINLPKGHAFLMINGRLYKIRLPFTTLDDTNVPDELLTVMESMKSTYSSSDNWFVDKWYFRQIAGVQDQDINSLYDFGETSSSSSKGKVIPYKHDDFQAVNVIETQELAMLGESMDDSNQI